LYKGTKVPTLLLDNTITKLIFGPKFNKILTPGVFPTSITYLEFGKGFKKSLVPGVFPSSLTTLLFNKSSTFNRVLEVGVLPESLQILQLGHYYNQEIELNVLPQSLVKLLFSQNSLYNLPIKHGVLPSSLQVLNLGYTFNSIIEDNVLPQSIIDLALSTLFSHPLTINNLPRSLTKLMIGHSFDHTLAPGTLPITLIEICMGKYINWNPHNYIELTLQPGLLPSSLTKFELLSGDYQPRMVPGTFPNTLTSLTFDLFSKPLEVGFLPSSLTYLDFGRVFNRPIDSLRTMVYEPDHPEGVYRTTLPNLQSLVLGSRFNNPILEGVFGLSLTYIEIGWAFNFPLIPGVLPSSLKKLILGDSFNYALDQDVLPPSLKSLAIGRKFKRQTNFRKLDSMTIHSFQHLKLIDFKAKDLTLTSVHMNKEVPTLLEKFRSINIYSQDTYRQTTFLFRQMVEFLKYLILSIPNSSNYCLNLYTLMTWKYSISVRKLDNFRSILVFKKTKLDNMNPLDVEQTVHIFTLDMVGVKDEYFNNINGQMTRELDSLGAIVSEQREQLVLLRQSNKISTSNNNKGSRTTKRTQVNDIIEGDTSRDKRRK
ncbi:hypothetical protein SAMD00019534_115090, partial [Acytostelium subglobosum LB1]|uniref:hypothetical protein n=1 Tax=Acytostelium subglobosum LB1 TaxID=1410327 RepID=UPI0006451B41